MKIKESPQTSSVLCVAAWSPARPSWEVCVRLRHASAVLFACVAVLAAACSDPGGKKPALPDVELDRTTSAAGATPVGDTGLPAGTLRKLWQDDLPDVPSPDAVAVELVAGQIVVVSERGLDVYDANSGKARWHYHEVARLVTGYTIAPDAVVLTTTGTKDGKRSHDDKLVRSTGLDAATGRTLWTAHRRLLGVDETLAFTDVTRLRRDFPPAKAGIAVFQALDEKDRGLVGLDARTGKQRWTWQGESGDDCTYTPRDTDGSLLLLQASCTGTTYALDPASGAVRWKKQGQPDTVTRGGVTLATDYSGGKRNDSTLVTADGKEIWKLTGSPLAAVELAVAGDRAVLTVEDHDRGYGMRLEFVDLRTGKVDRRVAARRHDRLFTAGGHVYGARQWLGEYQDFKAGLDPRILPGGLDVIDPVQGTVTTVPLPFRLDGDDIGRRPRPVLVEGDRLVRVQATTKGLRLTAYGAGGRRTPVETGGVAPADWPDACELAAGAAGGRGTQDDPERPLRLGAVKIPHWGCRVGGADALQFTIGWVARTPADAQALLDGMGDGEAEDVGDATYRVETPLGTRLVMRTGRYIVVFKSAALIGSARSVAEAVDKALR